jgi:hypothetical protein
MDRVVVGSTDHPVLQRSVPTEEIQGHPLALAEGSTPGAVRGSLSRVRSPTVSVAWPAPWVDGGVALVV